MSDTTPRTIMVVEDDRKIAALLADYLAAAGHAPVVIGDGRLAVARLRALAPAAILLDLNLPGLDGLEVCRAIRRQSNVPILMVTARVDEIDRIVGLEIGADDYVCKPFSPKEVVARIAALLRRAEGRLEGASLWRIDEAGLKLIWNGHNLALTPIEFRICATLFAAPGRAFQRGQLLDRAHDDFRDVSDRAIDSHIKNIRRKLEEAGAPPACISAVYGVGYRFDPPGA